MPLADPGIKNYAQFYQKNGAFVLILGNFDPSNRFQTHQEIAKGASNKKRYSSLSTERVPFGLLYVFICFRLEQRVKTADPFAEASQPYQHGTLEKNLSHRV